MHVCARDYNPSKLLQITWSIKKLVFHYENLESIELIFKTSSNYKFGLDKEQCWELVKNTHQNLISDKKKREQLRQVKTVNALLCVTQHAEQLADIWYLPFCFHFQFSSTLDQRISTGLHCNRMSYSKCELLEFQNKTNILALQKN